MFARQQAAVLMKIKNKTDQAGIALVGIGSAKPDQAKTFVDSFSFEGEIYCDPRLETFKAFGLNRGFFKTLGPASLMQGFSTMKKGFRQGKSAGDLWQQGGLFVIGPGNNTLFSHRNRFAGDQADLSSVIKKIDLNRE